MATSQSMMLCLWRVVKQWEFTLLYMLARMGRVSLPAFLLECCCFQMLA
jgi:hypothetical protein